MSRPIQPLELDDNNVLRFKKNKIVDHLLRVSGMDLNSLALVDPKFSEEDWEQFAQLIGYSLSGFSDLSYVKKETVDRAELQAFWLTSKLSEKS